MKIKSFLLSDENIVELEELTTIIKQIGFNEVQQSTNANDAWSLLQIKDLGCLISAWEMQDMSGLSLLKIVRTSDRFFNLPFFLTHSACTMGMVIQAGQAGATGLIVKPFNKNNIKKKIMAIHEIVSDPNIVETENSLQDALKLIEKQNYGTALGILNNLIKKEESPEYYYNIGYIKTAQGEYSEAIKAFRKAAALDRLFAKAYEGMGRAYQKLGQIKEAEKYMTRAADIYMAKENIEEAEYVLNEIKEISPDTINIYNSLGVLHRKKGEFKKALVNYKKALKLHPDKAPIHYNIGRVYIEMKDPEIARPYFVKALQLDPKFEDAKEVLEAIEFGIF
jgi:Flp pilus assembly protein TadD/FixJ family two-component response regulator